METTERYKISVAIWQISQEVLYKLMSSHAKASLLSGTPFKENLFNITVF